MNGIFMLQAMQLCLRVALCASEIVAGAESFEMNGVAPKAVFTFRWAARVVILAMLLFYVLAWPSLFRESGATLAHPEYGGRFAAIVTVQAAAALASIVSAPLLRNRRWFWCVAGSVAFWLPLVAL